MPSSHLLCHVLLQGQHGVHVGPQEDALHVHVRQHAVVHHVRLGRVVVCCVLAPVVGKVAGHRVEARILVVYEPATPALLSQQCLTGL